jgi:hypothetical protein
LRGAREAFCPPDFALSLRLQELRGTGREASYGKLSSNEKSKADLRHSIGQRRNHRNLGFRQRSLFGKFARLSNAEGNEMACFWIYQNFDILKKE